ncbi:MAG: RIP metalloprotease RseP [Chitinivibrionales bacterium]|nr:RIP metalloprotease RseP [Chitinivibrionales bacterium]
MPEFIAALGANVTKLPMLLLMWGIGIFVLGLLVFVHELGHFLMAKWCGIRVLAFAVGFGKPLAKWHGKDGTEYRLCAIPFGGYVHMAGEHPEDGTEGKPDEFGSKSIWQRGLVALFGPLFNYVSAFLLIWIIYMVGVNVDKGQANTRIGGIIRDLAQDNSELQVGDSLLTINGITITSWKDVSQAFVLKDEVLRIKLIRDGERKIAELKIDTDDSAQVINSGGLLPYHPPVVDAVSQDTPAQHAGLHKGDTIATINGNDITTWSQISYYVSKYDSSKAPMVVGIKRKNSYRELEITPQYNADYNSHIIGISFERSYVIQRFGPVQAFMISSSKAWDFTTLVFKVIGKIASRDVSVKNLSGPVGIVSMSGGMALNMPFSELMMFIAMIGINLAVLNLLPLIITDGGILFFLAIEAVRGKPLPTKVQLVINQVAIVLFITLFVFVTFNDFRNLPRILRIFSP